MPHIFISYAKKDTRSLAIQLTDALNAIEGVTAWVDRSLRAGQSWEVQIQAQIDRCDAMVVLYSPDINRHKHGQDESYVLTEISYAKYTVRKPIIPVMAQRTEPPIALASAHYIDFTLDGLTLDDLVQALCDEVGMTYSANLITPSLREIVQNKLDILNILPPPFEWIEIPAGEFTMGHEDYSHNPPRKVTLPTFRIAKYPVTNAQYAKFIEAEGYREPKWWIDAGWQVREANKWIEPRRWNDHNFNSPEQPVNALSWYESVAFARWLKDATGENVTLPLEAQWEKAARGRDGRLYPWGNTFDQNRCNTRESSIGKTTLVRQYEGKGDSPFGVVDMAGNVWEWCLDQYSNPQIDPSKVNLHSTDARVLRGGSFSSNLNVAVASSRLGDDPYFDYNSYGLRLVLCAP